MKKVLLAVTVSLLLLCAVAITVNAEECAHKDNWEIKFGPDGALGAWEAINICPDCDLVLKDEFLNPLINTRGYSYDENSFSQGFTVDYDMIEKYEKYSGEAFDFGLVAGISSQMGLTPINEDGTTSNDGAVVATFNDNKISIFDIKIVNVPKEQQNTKIVACMFAIAGGEVAYIDGESIADCAVGVTFNEVVDAVENGAIPKNTEKYRKLEADEMEILWAHYWKSDVSTVRQTVNYTPEKFVSTRMFTRDELPEGSYVVVASGWKIRPEVWATDENGNIKKTSNRPGEKSADTYAIETLWQDTDTQKSNYKYMAFNLSEDQGGYLENMTPEGVANILQIYVPQTTKVAKNEVEKKQNVSVEGMQVLEWTTDNFYNGRYWNNGGAPSTKPSSQSNLYYASCQFTEETLPVGSVIEINTGWLYRAEYWINDAKTSPRGPMVDTYRIVVTEEFWGNNITQRGFTISTMYKDTLSKDDWDEVATAFKIYIPVN